MKLLPHWVIYTDRWPDDVGGRANGPIVRIRPRYRDDAGIHAHEYEHVRQWYVASLMAVALLVLIVMGSGHGVSLALAIAPLGCAAHPVGYRLSLQYRLWCEVQAYRVQMRHGLSLDGAAARLMSTRYGLRLRRQDAVRLLSE